MSYYSVPDGTHAVNRRTPTRLAGRGPVVGRWLNYDLNAEWRHKSPGELARDASAFWLVPPSMQAAAWWRLVALTNELAERLLCLSIVDADGAESEVA